MKGIFRVKFLARRIPCIKISQMNKVKQMNFCLNKQQICNYLRKLINLFLRDQKQFKNNSYNTIEN